MIKIILVLLLLNLLLADIDGSRKKQLEEPSYETFIDQTEIIALAQNQKFSLPITTRTISHRLQTLPQNSNQCQLVSESLLYRSLATGTLSKRQEFEIVEMLALKKKEKIFLVDQNHNILSYSLDQHFLLKDLAPKTNMMINGKKSTTVAMASTEDEEFVYYLTPEKYYVFQTESLGSEIILQQPLPGDVIDVQKVIVYRGYFFVLSRQMGPLIYKIDKATHKLSLMQSLIEDKIFLFADMQFERNSELLYILAINSPTIQVFHFEPAQFPDINKKFIVFQRYDSIDIEQVTNKHGRENEQKNMHVNLQISTKREQQTLMVLFMHNYRYVIAEILYEPIEQSWSFVRYFKFGMRINQIHIVKDVVIVVGMQTIGIFPYGIHPLLIEEELNGFMTLTSIFRLKVLENGRFVGITKNTIEYGIIKLDERAELTCKIQEGTKLKTIKLKANLTACSNQDRVLYQNYCSYEKTFFIEEMQLAVSAPIADSLWTGMLIFLVLIILGICILFSMQQRKQREIRRLELYFQEKRRQPPPSSERRTNKM